VFSPVSGNVNDKFLAIFGGAFLDDRSPAADATADFRRCGRAKRRNIILLLS